MNSFYNGIIAVGSATIAVYAAIRASDALSMLNTSRRAEKEYERPMPPNKFLDCFFALVREDFLLIKDDIHSMMGEKRRMPKNILPSIEMYSKLTN